MHNRDDSDPLWDELAEVLSQMRLGLDNALAEAARRFAGAPEESFSRHAVDAMVAVAMDRWLSGEEFALRDTLSDLIFRSDAKLPVGDTWAEAISDELCSFVGWQPRGIWDHLMTRISSTSVDTRAVRSSRVRLDRRMRFSTDPIVLDVGAGLGEQGTRQMRKVREGTVCWDARFDTTGSELLDYAVAHSTSFDFADYDDEVVKELLRN